MKENKKFKALKAGLGNGLVIELDRAPVAKRKKVKIDNTKWAYNQTVDEHYLTVAGYTYGFDEHITPHLFPLSMLTKPIRIEGYNGGKEFVPAKELFKGFENLRLNTFVDKDYNLWATYTILEDEVFTIPIIGAKGIKDVDHWIVEQLHEWHFNVFNLDESEFIDASISKCYEPK